MGKSKEKAGIKSKLIVALLLCGIYSNAQLIELDVSNPSPRLGEQLNIKLRLVNLTETSDSIKIGSGEVILIEVTSDTGTIDIGPFSFFVDGREYRSSIVSLIVIPQLPPVREGFWIRQVYFENKDYLVLEQRMPGEWQESNERNSLKLTFGSSKEEFAEIDTERFDTQEIDFQRLSWTTYSQSVDQNKPGNLNAQYRRTIYEIKKGPEFAGSYVLKKEDFKNSSLLSDFEKYLIR